MVDDLNTGQVTNGELYRLMLSHGEVLKEIKADVKAQNGRVTKLEGDAIRIKTLWSVGTVVVVFLVDWLKRKLGY